VVLYGIVGSIVGATYAYFSGTITTLEKRFKIPSKNTGIISIGNDISTIFLTATLSYIAGKGHRPRWIAFGVYAVVTFCLLCTLPHILYGPGEQALSLTKEYSERFEVNNTQEFKDLEEQKKLCQLNCKSCWDNDFVFTNNFILF
jgi:organic anion transporter 5A